MYSKLDKVKKFSPLILLATFQGFKVHVWLGTTFKTYADRDYFLHFMLFNNTVLDSNAFFLEKEISMGR